MRLTLSMAEQRQVEALSTTMLSAADYPDPTRWCAAIKDGAQALTGADSGGGSIPLDGHTWAWADNVEAARDYYGRTRVLDRRLRFIRRAVELGAYDRQTLFRPVLDRYLASSYYNEYIVPHRLFDGIGLAVPVGPGTGLDDVAQLILHHENRRRRFGPRGPALLRLVLPAFRAGALAWSRFARQRGSLLAALDELRDPLLLCDGDGRPLHANVALADALAADPEGARLRQELERFGRDLARNRRTPAAPPPAERTLRTARAQYQARGSFSETLLADGRAILISVDRRSPPALEADDLARRHGLTPAQARVALFLARGASNAEIAAALTISPATARNHTARIREKLGVGSRARIAAVLLGGGEGRGRPGR